MAVEAKRGCGYRKAGGIYLVAGGMGEPCERLPMGIPVCPIQGDACLKQGRGFQWINPKFIFEQAKACTFEPKHCPTCSICQPVLMERNAEPKDRVGFVWVGEGFYSTPQEWSQEAFKMGVSRRIAAIPKGLVVGKTWVFAAHPKAIAIEKKSEKKEGDLLGTTEWEYKPGVFHAFIPQKIEVVVTPSMKEEKWVKDLVEKHKVDLVEVPENDPDHAPPLKKKSARAASMEKHAKKIEKTKADQEEQAPPLRKVE